ncbi:hypothetical protein [Serratia ureilytica]|uniref:hypothetical protein n=1 Tax=Serratia ureilytica TaxID=300181 RepID=UPI003F80B557
MRVQYKTKISKAILRSIYNLPDENYFNFPIYRYFKDEGHADALTKGYVWLSTLKTCREYEDTEQGDKQEALLNIGVSHIQGSGNDKEFIDNAMSIGIKVTKEAEGMIITNSHREISVSDGYVLCTSTQYSEKLREKFGEYCVKIDNPFLLAETIHQQLSIDTRIKSSHQGLINYCERSYFDKKPPTVHVGFIKPPFPYAYQKEHRLLYIPDDCSRLEPRGIDCPYLKDIFIKL